MIRVAAAGRQWIGANIKRELQGSCSRITPLVLQHYSTAGNSERAYTGSEIINFMGGLDGEKQKMIHRLVNFRMKQGKKTRVRTKFYDVHRRLAHEDRDGIQLISDAVENVKPICEVSKVRIAGNIYDVPAIVEKDRQQTLAVRWILDAAFARRKKAYEKRNEAYRKGPEAFRAIKRVAKHGPRLEDCLFTEIMDAYRKQGDVREKRKKLHELASNNRGYSHFRWW